MGFLRSNGRCSNGFPTRNRSSQSFHGPPWEDLAWKLSGPWSNIFYRRYVDDTYCLFNNEHDALLFFDYITSQQRNIKFTREKEENYQLPFLDVLIDNGQSEFPFTSVFRKKTYTGLLTNIFSFTPSSYKLGLIRTLVDRAFKINNTWKGFNKDINQLTSILMKNCFPCDIIQRKVNNYLCKFFNHDNLPRDGQTKKSSTFFFKLPFIGPFSRATQRRIKVTTKKYCKDLDIKFSFYIL